MAEKLSVYLDATTILKLHDIHRLISAGIPGGISVSKTVAFAISVAHATVILDDDATEVRE